MKLDSLQLAALLSGVYKNEAQRICRKYGLEPDNHEEIYRILKDTGGEIGDDEKLDIIRGTTVKKSDALIITYVDSKGKATERRIHPEGIRHKHKDVEIRAYCHERKAGRSFLLSRMEKISFNGEEIDPKALLQFFPYYRVSASDLVDKALGLSDEYQHIIGNRKKARSKAIYTDTFTKNGSLTQNNNIPSLIDAVHDDVKNLLWYSNADYRNYENSYECEIEIESGGILYHGTIEEPSLILTTEEIDSPLESEEVKNPNEYRPHTLN